MNEQIDASTWLDDESKTLAKEKLNSMKIFVGFPDWYKNKKSVTKFYKGVRMLRASSVMKSESTIRNSD